MILTIQNLKRFSTILLSIIFLFVGRTDSDGRVRRHSIKFGSTHNVYVRLTVVVFRNLVLLSKH
jgi:hypothetical protein